MKLILMVLCTSLITACSTTARFKVPEGTDLYVFNNKVEKSEYSQYKRRPFGWGQAAGIPYRLEKNGKIQESGTLKSSFRVVSIFWPPVALAYWPMGMKGDHGLYDFTEQNEYVRPAKARETK